MASTAVEATQVNGLLWTLTLQGGHFLMCTQAYSSRLPFLYRFDLQTPLNGYVGFDTITQQIEKKLLKRGFQFNVMVVGNVLYSHLACYHSS